MSVNLTQWAIQWGIPYAAVEDLRRKMGMDTDPHTTATGESEAAVSAAERREASAKGARLWRNNVGHCVDNRGNHIRYGLANDSKELNRVCKSSDLIGIEPVVIEPCHIGWTIGRFVARETKAAGWRWSGSEHEQAQLNFLNLVLSLGGNAAFTNRPGSL